MCVSRKYSFNLFLSNNMCTEDYSFVIISTLHLSTVAKERNFKSDYHIAY